MIATAPARLSMNVGSAPARAVSTDLRRVPANSSSVAQRASPNPEQTAVAVCESAPGHPPSADTKALVLSFVSCTAAQAQEAPASTFGAYGEQSDHKTLQSESTAQCGSRNSSQRPSLHTAAVGLAEIQKLVPHILGSSSFDTSAVPHGIAGLATPKPARRPPSLLRAIPCACAQITRVCDGLHAFW